MTDAALSVTQSAVEQFAERYLTSIGCSIEKRDGSWRVNPDDAESEFVSEETVLALEEEAAETEEVDGSLQPESSFFQQLLEEAAERAPAGKISLNAADTTIQPPAWLRESPVELVSADFTPYYDRTAVVFLVRVSVETVSEYQQEFLRAVAVDERSMDLLPGLEETFLRLATPGETGVESDSPAIDRQRAEQLTELARETVVDRMQPRIDEIHRDASRAADEEVEEYRQLQEQRIEELEDDIERLDERIEELNRTVQGQGGQNDRVERLKERKDLKAEREDLTSGLEDLRTRRERGFPDEQAEIRNRHAIDVVVTPLTATEVEYERGEISLVLKQETESRTMRVGYGSGVGISEAVHCDSCESELTDENPLASIQNGLRCSNCDYEGS